jgi:hypothetical protein
MLQAPCANLVAFDSLSGPRTSRTSHGCRKGSCETNPPAVPPLHSESAAVRFYAGDHRRRARQCTAHPPLAVTPQTHAHPKISDDALRAVMWI